MGAHANNGVARRPVAAYLEMEPAVRLKKHNGMKRFPTVPKELIHVLHAA